MQDTSVTFYQSEAEPDPYTLGILLAIVAPFSQSLQTSMFSVKHYGIALLLTLACASQAQETAPRWAETLNMFWELRAQAAAERVEALRKLLSEMPPDKKNGAAGNEVMADMAVQIAYAIHKDVPNTVRKISKRGIDCHLVISGGKSGMFDLAYRYAPDGQLEGMHIDRLPSDWRILLTRDPDEIEVQTPQGYRFIFNKKHPFTAKGRLTAPAQY